MGIEAASDTLGNRSVLRSSSRGRSSIQAWRLFVPDEKYWNVICPVCGCPSHAEDGGFCWSETAEVITDVVLRTVATVQEIEGSMVEGREQT